MGHETGDALEFEAWLAGRSSALTRLAFLMTGSAPATEQALQIGLSDACLGWSRIRRSDDPEREVRRLVVSAHLRSTRRRWRRTRPESVAVPRPAIDGPAPPGDPELAWRALATLTSEQRTAVVLRCYAAMTYPQIAVLMDLKESVAATRVQDAFAAVAASIDGPRTEVQLEGALEEAFGEHADDAPDHGERAPVARVGARRRRRRRLLSATAVTAGVATVGALLAISYDAGDRATAVDAGPHPDGWRAESYQGVQLWVPTSWGWGIVPTTTPQGLVGCRVGAFSSTALIADLRYIVKGGPPPPYVGRPMSTGGSCPYASVRNQAHVWFGSPLVVGTSDGQTTVRAHGVTTFNITVADPNRAERLTILRSIQPVDQDAHWCPRDSAGLRSLEEAADPEPASAFVQTLSLCFYTDDGSGGRALFYSTAVAGMAAQRATTRIEAAPTRGAGRACLDAPAVDRLLLIARTPAGPALFTVDPGACLGDPVGYRTGSSLHLLTKESVRLWAVDGLPLYLAAGRQDSRVTPYLPGF